MCVMLYLTVLTLEFAPTVLEHPLFSARPFRAALRILKKVTIPLVITGIVLSTLHQSSLGSLFLITPYRLHPLWYSHIIYLLFFVSAVGLGLMMVVLESLLSAYFLDHEIHTRELAGLGKAASVVLWIYVALRLGDLALRGELGSAVDGSWHGALFVGEMGLSAVIPAALLMSRRVRESRVGMGVAAAFTVTGMVFYRLDVSILSFARPPGFGYHPSWEEIAVSAGIVAAFALIFIFFVERLRVYDDVAARPRTEATPSYDPATARRLQPRDPGRSGALHLSGARRRPRGAPLPALAWTGRRAGARARGPQRRGDPRRQRLRAGPRADLRRRGGGGRHAERRRATDRGRRACAAAGGHDRVQAAPHDRRKPERQPGAVRPRGPQGAPGRRHLAAPRATT